MVRETAEESHVVPTLNVVSDFFSTKDFVTTKSWTLNVPSTSRLYWGDVVPIPTYPDVFHIPEPGKYVFALNVCAPVHVFALLKFNDAITLPIVGDTVNVPSELLIDVTPKLPKLADVKRGALPQYILPDGAPLCACVSNTLFTLLVVPSLIPPNTSNFCVGEAVPIPILPAK